MWTNFFKKPRDLLLGYSFLNRSKKVRTQYAAMPWNKVYDLIEFICNHSNWERRLGHNLINKFIKSCNKILEEKISGYRIIDDNVVPITSKTELNEIEQALQAPMTNIGNHLKRALELLSDRDNPDHPNSVKESISSVEAICRKVVGSENLTLGQALNAMKKLKPFDLHPSMINAISNFYGYSSAVGGARHAMHNDGEKISFAEAKFFSSVLLGLRKLSYSKKR